MQTPRSNVVWALLVVLVWSVCASASGNIPARAETTLEEINAARAARISPVPDVVGAVRVFGAEEARPSWNDMGGLTLERDAYGDGMHRMHIKKRTLGRSAYWKMHDIEPGGYYLGLWVESHHRGVALAGGSNAKMDMEYSPEHLLATLYLNGFPVRFHTTADPVQVKEGVWLCELQTPAPVRIQEGDEIAFATVRWRLGGTRPVFRLALYREAPPAGHGITGQTLGVDHGTLQRLRLVPLASIEGSRIAGREHKARVVVANPLPSEVSAELEMALTDYFGKPVWTALERVEIPSHGTVERTHAFGTEARDHGYALNVRTRPTPGYRYPRHRPPEWMALNSYTDVEFRPDMGDPLTSWHQARMRFHEVRSGPRGKVSLAGRDWQRAWLATRRAPDTVPEDLDYAPQTIAAPEYATRLSVPKERFGVWLKRTFVLPDFMKGQRILLQFTAVREGGVFVNGQYFGAQIGRFIPQLFDITAATREGENELVLCVREEVALVCEDFVDRYDRSDRKSIKKNVARMTRWMSPGKVSCGSVTLMSEPRVGVRQAVTFSTPEKNQVRVVLRLRNSTDKPRTVNVAFTVDQQGNEKNVSITPLSVTLPPGETVEAGTDGVANDLIAYEPDRPVPARLTVSVSDTDGILLDKFQQRFGYRNYRVDGLTMRYNGLPARFQGSAFTRENSILEREGCVRLERIANDEDRLDALSSLGISVYPWVGTHGLNSRQTFLNERYWQDHRELAVEFMWRYGSQPCVVGLNISNETVYYNISPFSKEEIEQYADRIFSIANAVRETFDWDLWCQADGDGDLGGRLNFHSTHYLTQTSRYVPGTLGVHKRAESVGAYSPDRWYLSGAAHPPKHGTTMPRRVKPDFVYGSKALADTETFWFILNGPTAARELGDRATVSAAWQFYTLEGRHWCWLAYEGYRDMDMCSHISLSWDDLYGTFQQPVWFALPEQQVRYYSGRRFDRRLNLHDDEFCPGDIRFAWDLRGTDREPLEAGEILQRSSTAWLYRDRLAFDLPKVKERTELTLNMKVEKGGRVFKHERRLVEVWPDRTASFTPGADGNAPSVQAAFDPRGDTAPLLDRVGWQAQRIGRLDAEALAGIDRLVIGAEVETEDAARTRGVLLRFMEKGGRVLMLHQTSAGLVSETSDMYDARGWVSTAFIRTPKHPVLKGLTDRDFTMWQPEHLLARGIYARGIKGDPFTGSALTLLDGYHAMSLNWSLLLELYAGTGSMLACQIRIPETFEDEPVSAELLCRMLAYLREPAYKQMGRHLLVAQPASEPVIDALNNLRARYEFAKRPFDDAGDAVLLVDLSLKNGRPESETLKAFARAGGILILHRARPEHASWLSALAGTPVTVDVQPYRSWADRQMLERRDGLLEGLSNIDLYWRPIFRDGSPFGFFQVSANPTHEHGQVQYVVRAKGAEEYLFPGGLAELPVGAGRIVFDQLGWERPDEKTFLSSSYTYGILPSRTLAVLLTNLGIRRRQPAPPLELPPGVQYTTIDISAAANRALKDEQARDGIGWKDWGPESDLSAFPTGSVTFNGVPFHVPEGRHNAIVLRPAKRWLPALAELPDKVVIPVNRSRVAGLWFLQTGGWTYGSKTFARREIRYADGTAETIRLSGLNFADWNIVRDSFPDERPDTRTLPAWTGTTKRWPVVRVYQQLWLNPTPGKPIKEVILTVADQPEDNRRFIAHLALTAALLPEPAPQPVRADEPAAERQPERSRKLLAAARKLHQDGNKKGALAALDKALISDNTNAGAWDLYASLLAPDAEPAEFRSLCERWAAAIPEAARPWNVLGRFYESKKMMREALSAYRKSLDVEWNQPDIMKSIQRLERR